MDLVRGGSVQTLLGDHGPLPESYVAVVLDQTLQALEAIHAAGVVHRDIKPANLLLEPTGTGRPVVRVGDFGVAALVDDVRLTRVPGAIGTDGYMAPEQVAGSGARPAPGPVRRRRRRRPDAHRSRPAPADAGHRRDGCSRCWTA